MAWYHHKADHKKTFEGDPKVILDFLEQADSKKFLYLVHRPLTEQWSYGVQAKTIRTMLNNGHTDIEIWLMANPSKKVFDSYAKRQKILQTSSANVVLDLDNIPFIQGNSPDERKRALVTYLRKVSVPLPTILVETSPGSFHLWYNHDARHPIQWNFDRLLAMSVKIAQITKAEFTSSELCDLLKRGGVDYKYLKQSLSQSKFRVPGSINYYKSCAANERHLVYGWNLTHEKPVEDYIPYHEVFQFRLAENKPKQAVIKPMYVHNNAKKYIPILFKHTKGMVEDRDVAMQISRVMAENINLLTNDSFRILQTRLADQIGIPQPTLSRIIKRMVYGGVLNVIKGYKVHKFAKTYGIGPKVKRDIKVEMIGNAYDFWLPYEDGNSWNHFLEDVRQAVYKQIGLRGITEIISEKQNMRPAHKQRSLKEIENAYKSCLTYQQERRHLSAS